MALSPDITVGELAGRFPATIPVFQRFGIEFCCGGRRTLARACREGGLAYDRVVAELSPALTIPQRRNWADRPVTELITHIAESFHEPLRQELPRLHEMALRLESHASWPGHPIPALRHELARFRSEIEAHISEEEQTLFPLVERLEEGTLQPGDEALLAELRAAFETDHVIAGRSLRTLRELSDDYQLPNSACSTMRALYHGLEELEALMYLHVHMENNVLFPRAATLVGAAGLERL